jgi:hypothetical protein
MSVSPEELVPAPGHWPVDPQDDVPIREDRIYSQSQNTVLSHHEIPELAT